MVVVVVVVGIAFVQCVGGYVAARRFFPFFPPILMEKRGVGRGNMSAMSAFSQSLWKRGGYERGVVFLFSLLNSKKMVGNTQLPSLSSLIAERKVGCRICDARYSQYFSVFSQYGQVGKLERMQIRVRIS